MNFYVKNLIWALGLLVLFALLTPGALLTLPTKGITVAESWTEWSIIGLHALIFAAVFYLIKCIVFWTRPKRVGASSAPTSTNSSSAASSKK
jgi:hypothetical protein